MRKIFNKVLAGVTSVALVATLLIGMNVTNNVKADETLKLTNWTFSQGGQYNPNEAGNEGYINSVTMNGTNETLTNWLKGGEASVNQLKQATQEANGFTIDIENTGWDAQWDQSPNRINPWSIQALVKDVDVIPGHIYTVSFKAKASQNKFCYVAFGCDVEGTTPYAEAPVEGSEQLIKIGTAEQTYTYTFTNWVSAKKLTTTLMLGAFDAMYDYAGNDISDILGGKAENQWKGTVSVSDFSITDKGQDPGFVLPPPPQTTPSGNNNNNNNNNNGGNVNPPVNTTPQAPATVKKLAKVKKLKAVSKKKGTVKVTWQKVKNAKTYQVKVGKKTYNTKKAKLTVKKVKKGKVVVKVRAKAAGFKTSAWATKKVKVK